MKLIVTQAFGNYAQGAFITDGAEIQRILKSPQAAYVMQIADALPTPVASSK